MAFFKHVYQWANSQYTWKKSLCVRVVCQVNIGPKGMVSTRYYDSRSKRYHTGTPAKNSGRPRNLDVVPGIEFNSVLYSDRMHYALCTVQFRITVLAEQQSLLVV
jgi:hypothetical protein